MRPFLLAAAFLALATPAFAQGYSGLFAEDPDQAETPAETVPATPSAALPVPAPAPAPISTPRIKTSDDLKAQAEIHSAIRQNTFVAPTADWGGVTKAPRDDNGKLAKENAMAYLIDSYMKLVDNPKLTAEKKKENAQLVYRQLQNFAASMQIMNNVPASTYQQLGTPETYVMEEKQARANMQVMIRQAMERLKPYQ